MLIVGLAGAAGCGKDTVGEILKEEHGFYLTSFAFPIKRMVTQLLGHDVDKWHDREWRETPVPILGVTPRYMAQSLGTEWGRHCISPSIWLDLCLESIAEELVDDSKVAITDVRFENEATKIRALEGGQIVHVTRSNLVGVGEVGHASEVGLMGYAGDRFVDNDGDLADLKERVHWLIEGAR